jgi:hypothetical protein
MGSGTGELVTPIVVTPTPADILSQAKSKFSIMYLNETRLSQLLRIALGTFQDKAGLIKKEKTTGENSYIALPNNFLDIAVVMDARGAWCDWEVESDKISVVPESTHKLPYTIHYFVNLRDYPENEGLPSEIVGKIKSYLEVLIEIENNQRHRQVLAATNMQADVPDSSELENKKQLTEQDFEDAQAIIPIATVSYE